MPNKSFLAHTAVFFILCFLILDAKIVCAQSVSSTALPQNLNCVAGDCNGFSVTTNGNTMNVNVSGVAVGQATSGDIGSQATVNYNLNGNFLERITGGDPTTIAGDANVRGGSLFLVNTNGIVFTGSAQVNAPGLVASTLDINNSDFLAGKYNFYQNGGSASITNAGLINITNGGYAILLSNSISNSGDILADLGTVALATGQQITVALDSANDISVTVGQADTSSVSGMTDAIKNTGLILADGGQIILNANALNGIFNNAINNTDGVLQANNLSNNNGSIDLTYTGGPVQTGTITTGGIPASGLPGITIDGVTAEYGTLTASNGGLTIEGSFIPPVTSGALTIDSGTLNIGTFTGGSVIGTGTGGFIGGITTSTNLNTGNYATGTITINSGTVNTGTITNTGLITGVVTTSNNLPITTGTGSTITVTTTSTLPPPTIIMGGSITLPVTGASFTNTGTFTYVPAAAVLNTTQGTINQSSVKLLNTISANTAAKTLSATNSLSF